MKAKRAPQTSIYWTIVLKVVILQTQIYLITLDKINHMTIPQQYLCMYIYITNKQVSITNE